MSNKTSTNPSTTSESVEAPQAPPAPATDRPQALTNEQLQLIASGGDTAAAEVGKTTETIPTMAPPGTTAGAAASSVGLTFSGQKVTVLWADEANRNSWVHLEAAGWKRLSQVSDNGSTNLTLLSGHAREIAHAPYAGDDSGGAISFMYVW